MFETGIRQLRMARSMIWGKPFDVRSVEALVADALSTLDEFGAPGDDLEQLLDGPFADPEIRRRLQDRAIRRTVRHAVASTPYYRELFGRLGLDGDDIGIAEFAVVPVTTKQDLAGRCADFIAEGTRPQQSTRTTGSSGSPVQIWTSADEARLWPALAALAGVLRGEIGPADVLQVNISSRATAAIQHDVSVCRLAGARIVLLGLIDPLDSLDVLQREATTILSTYPSYLAELVAAAERTGSRTPALRRIDCGGELLSMALTRRAERVFGARVVDSFAMTEVLPVSARHCTAGHLHHDLNSGYVEFLALDSDVAVAAGEAGRVVITPYYPLRHCMPVIRYDTGDVVRPLDDGELTCELAGMPATTPILGSTADVLAASRDGVTPRLVVEALDALPRAAQPPRFALLHTDGTAVVEVAAESLTAQLAADLEQALAAAGGTVEVRRVRRTDAGWREPEALRAVRADLREATFTHRSSPEPGRLTERARA